jgi:molecular chaperone DnaJ
VRARRTITVKIPAGVDHGTRVQLGGEGEVGPGGGPAGDLYVEIQVAPHPVFLRDGSNLRCHVSVPMTAAALGTTVELPLLEADIAEEDSDVQLWVDLDIRPGTQSGTEQVLRGYGVPSLRSQARGDLVVTIDVETPTRIDERQEEILRELAKLRHEESPDGKIHPGHRTVFGRLRDAFGPR